MLTSYPVEKHLIESKHVDQTFEISVMQPLCKTDGSERFAVVYVTDGNFTFDALSGLSHGLHFGGDAPRFIVVGIGYPGHNPWAGSYLRARDFLSDDYPFNQQDMPSLPFVDVPRPGGAKQWAGAADFLEFIATELIPFVDERYPTIKENRTYYGHSAGGYFGLYTLFHHGELFENYIISSPGLATDDHNTVFSEAENFLASAKNVRAKVYLSAGSAEDKEANYRQFRIAHHTLQMAECLNRAGISGLNIQSRIFPDETHMSVWPLAFSHGVRALLGPADGPLLSLSD